MVSQHADTEAYEFLMENLSSAVMSRVESLLDGRAKSRYPKRYQDKLLDLCDKIQEDEYTPQFMMIDGDDAERLAIERIFPGLPVRLCQFHFMQACKSKARTAFGRSQAGDGKTAAFLKALRRCQCCPVESEWPSFYGQLHQEINEIAQDGGRASAIFTGYFKTEWFADRWRSYCVDYGIPSHLTRDGPWSTNNYAEAAFRTFDRVFLSCRVNKRFVRSYSMAVSALNTYLSLDRLLVIIITTYLPFYKNHPNDVSRPDPVLIRQLFGGMSIWQSDGIHPCTRRTIPHLVHQLDTVYMARPPQPSSPTHVCGRRKDNGRQYCSCEYYSQTGKRCAGLWALATLELCGGVAEFESLCSASGAGIPQPKLKNRSMANRDDVDDLAEYWASNTIVEDPILALITTDLGLIDPKTSAGSVRTRDPSPVSPIGCRHRSIRPKLGDDPSESTKVSFLGRPPAIRPLQIRGKAQKSTLRVRREKHTTIGKPLGSRNTGTDCFALALFHILARQKEWMDAFRIVEKRAEHDPIIDLFGRFCRSLGSLVAISFPDLQVILSSK